MRYKYTSLFFAFVFLCAGQLFGQVASHTGFTLVGGNTDSEHAETLLIGPGDYTIDGAWEIYSKYVWIDPGANFTGNGTIAFYQTNTTVTPDVTPGPTYIDGNNVTIDVNIELHNDLNLVLADMTLTDPLDGWSDNPENASMGVGGNFSFEVDDADVIMGLVITDAASDHVDIENTLTTVTNFILGETGTLSNYGPSRMVVTSNSLGGHMVKTGTMSSFIFPVGITEGDYTPVAISPGAVGDSVFVSVQDYLASAVDEGMGPDGFGMDRTWHIYASTGSGSWTVNLQHNTSTEQGSFENMSHYVTRWDGTEWTMDMPGPGAAGTLTFGMAPDGSTSMRSGTFSSLSTEDVAESYYTKSSLEPEPEDPVNCVAEISPSIGPDGTITLQLVEVIPGNRNMPIYTVEVLNAWGGVIWKGENMTGTDLILEGVDICHLLGLKVTIRITDGEVTCYSTLMFDDKIELFLSSAFGNTVTDASDLDIPTAYIDTGLLVTYCGYIPDPFQHEPQVANPCNGSARIQVQVQPDWVEMYRCDEESDTTKIIYRTWEAFNKDGDLFTLTDTIVVLRLPALTASHFVGYSEDSVYCTVEPIYQAGQTEKRYAAWKQPVGLHDYERPFSQLRGVVYEIPLSIIIAGYVAAVNHGPEAVTEYLASVILRRAGGEEVTIGDLMSGDYLDDLRDRLQSDQLGYGFLHAIYQLGESPVSILGGLFAFFPYLLLEQGDWVLSEGGHFEKVTEDWFYTGHGSAPFWFTGGWPFVSSSGSSLWYIDRHPTSEAEGCGVRVLVPGLEDGSEGCVEICLGDLEGNTHCGITIEYEDTDWAWSGNCSQTVGRDILVRQSCWGTSVSECISDEFLATEGGDGFIVVDETITNKMRTFRLSQWLNLFDTIGPIFAFEYPLGICEEKEPNGQQGEMGPTGPMEPGDDGPQALAFPGGVYEECADLEWCPDDIEASIRAGQQYGSANDWERCHPTVYKVSSHDCSAEVYVPDVQVIDNCSGIYSVKAIVEVAGGSRMVNLTQTAVEYRIIGGDTTLVYTYSHLTNPIRINFNGCDGPLTEVRYEAADNCWNQSEWYKYIRIIDDIPPTVVVDREVNLSIGSGTEWGYAEETFDEGSWDNCTVDLKLIRRSDWAELIDVCADVTVEYDNWESILADLGIDPGHAALAASGTNVGKFSVEAAFTISDLAAFLHDGEIEEYFYNQLVWLWDDGQSCGRQVVHAWVFALAAYIGENCAQADDHGNTLDVRDLEYLFDHLFDLPGYGNEMALMGGGWAKAAPFYCNDACAQVTAELLVMDACCNWSIGWSGVNVEDKTSPRVAKPLADLEISCEAYSSFYEDVVVSAAALGENGSEEDSLDLFGVLDSLFGTYQIGASASEFDYYNITCKEVSQIDQVADTTHTGRIEWIDVVTSRTALDTTVQTSTHGIVDFVCEGEVMQDVWVDLDDCGMGTITRRFHIRSGCASDQVVTVSQVIEVGSACDMRKSMFDLPANYGSGSSPICLPSPLSDFYFPEELGRVSLKPELAGVLCSSISIGKDIRELDVLIQPGMKKYEITWRMRDWCSDVPADLTHTQVIIVRIDPGCEFDGGLTSSGVISGVLDRGNRVQREGFVLYQNHPNPFEEYTVIGFELPEATDAQLIIYEVTGKMIKEIKGEFGKGYNEVTISQDELSSAGMLYYQLETPKFVATKKMVRVNE